MGSRMSSCVGGSSGRKGSRGSSAIPATITFVPAGNRPRSKDKMQPERIRKDEEEANYGKQVDREEESDHFSDHTEGSFEAAIDKRLSRGKAELLQLQEEHYLLNESPVLTSLVLPIGLLSSDNYTTPQESLTPLLLLPLSQQQPYPFSPADRSIKMMIDQIFQACAHGNLVLLRSYFDSSPSNEEETGEVTEQQGGKPEQTSRQLDAIYTIRTICNLRHTCRNPLYQQRRSSNRLASPARPSSYSSSNRSSVMITTTDGQTFSSMTTENESLHSQRLLYASEYLELTLLQYCVFLNQCECIDYLLQFTNDYDCNAINPQYGYNALHFAILMQQWQALEHLCRDGRINIHERTLTNGQTAVHLAIEINSRAALDCLLRLKGPVYDIKQKDFSGNSILHMIAQYPQPEMMEMIVYFIEGKYFRYEIPPPLKQTQPSPRRVNSTSSNNTTHRKDKLQQELATIDTNYMLRKKKLIYEMKNHKGETAFTILEKKIDQLKLQFHHAQKTQKPTRARDEREILNDDNDEEDQNDYRFDETMTEHIAKGPGGDLQQELEKAQASLEILITISGFPFHFQETITSLGCHSPDGKDSKEEEERVDVVQRRAESRHSKDLGTDIWRDHLTQDDNQVQLSDHSSHYDYFSELSSFIREYRLAQL